MALEPGDLLGDKLYCQAFTSAEIKNADRLLVEVTDPRYVAEENKQTKKFVTVTIDSPIDGDAASVYLNETQVDDLIVALLYWKENH